MRSVAVMVVGLLFAAAADAAPVPLALWYGTPAANWEKEGLPIGNGAMGAMILGGVGHDIIQFNEKTLWTGGPGAAGFDRGLAPVSQKNVLAKVQALLNAKGQARPEEVAALLGHPVSGYGDYQSFGAVKLNFAGEAKKPAAYRRSLDLETAVANVSYETAGGHITRQYFASYPAGVIVMRFAAQGGAKISFTAAISVPANRSAVQRSENGRITVSGALKDNGLRYETALQILPQGGTRRDNSDGSVTVSNADSAVLILAAGTNYAAHYPDYRGPDPHEGVSARINAASARGYEELYREHVADYQALFSRVALDLGGIAPAKPTDAVLASYGAGDSAADRYLEMLQFQYGRYLLLASSRKGSLPSNLQGVWNPSETPPWNGDYHVNINLQMNYWLADVTGLPEAAIPFYDFVDSLVVPGRVSAKRMFGAKGWTVFLNTDIWGFSGVISWPTAFWQPEAGAWLASQYYDHYRFSLDRDFLEKRAYPVMKGAAELWLDALVSDPRDGKLVVSPSYSPEHGPFSAGAAMSQQIVYQLFAETADAARLSGDGSFAQKLDTVRAKLDPGLAIGRWGQLKEWKADWDDPKDEHRHTSQLYALHPGYAISPEGAPQLAEAAKVTLMARGDSTTSHGEAGTGWSKAWKMNFSARLHDGDHAHHLLGQLLRENAMANLWDAYVGPPFQIDANFGSAAAIAEMLVQSQNGIVEITPALPKAWPDGSVTGLRARGDLMVGIVWKGGRVVSVDIVSGHDGEVVLRAAAFTGSFILKDVGDGAAVAVKGEGDLRRFMTLKNHHYRLTNP